MPPQTKGQPLWNPHRIQMIGIRSRQSNAVTGNSPSVRGNGSVGSGGKRPLNRPRR